MEVSKVKSSSIGMVLLFEFVLLELLFVELSELEFVVLSVFVFVVVLSVVVVLLLRMIGVIHLSGSYLLFELRLRNER